MAAMSAQYSMWIHHTSFSPASHCSVCDGSVVTGEDPSRTGHAHSTLVFVTVGLVVAVVVVVVVVVAVAATSAAVAAVAAVVLVLVLVVVAAVVVVVVVVVAVDVAVVDVAVQHGTVLHAPRRKSGQQCSNPGFLLSLQLFSHVHQPSGNWPGQSRAPGSFVSARPQAEPHVGLHLLPAGRLLQFLHGCARTTGIATRNSTARHMVG